MKVSVIIPTFNSAKTIEDTLKSIIAQNWQDLQIIIQDGGSHDGTASIVKKYLQALSGWQSEPDRGIYDAMNKGIGRATGEIIAILNSDDVWLPGTLESVVSVFARNPDVGIVSGAIQVWEDVPDGARVILQSSLVHVHKGMTIQHPATFVRSEVYRCVGLFNTRYRIGADYDFVLRCLEANVPWVIVKDVLAFMRAGGKGGTHFSLDDWMIRRSHKLSSVMDETVTCASGFARYAVKRLLVSILGTKVLSRIRNYRWRKRSFR